MWPLSQLFCLIYMKNVATCWNVAVQDCGQHGEASINDVRGWPQEACPTPWHYLVHFQTAQAARGGLGASPCPFAAD